VALGTRIAVTFLLLLAAVLAAALGAVSATNRGNAEREVQRQLDVGASVFSRLLESNRRQLTQAAQAVASDYGFREAVASRDTDTLVSVLENSGQRIGAAMVGADLARRRPSSLPPACMYRQARRFPCRPCKGAARPTARPA